MMLGVLERYWELSLHWELDSSIAQVSSTDDGARFLLKNLTHAWAQLVKEIGYVWWNVNT